MKIIALTHTINDFDFVHVIVNDDDAAKVLKAIKQADKRKLFKAVAWKPDTVQDMLNYVKSENKGE